jgi:hypothetical protein
VRYCAIVAVILIAGASYSAELPRPKEAVDAGDSYRLKDGSRVALHRVVNEVAIKHLGSESIDPVLQQAGVDRDLLVALASIDGGKSHVVDLYQVDNSQAVDKLLSAQADGAAVFPVLMDPASRRRMIATDETIVQFAGGTSAPQATALLTQEGLEELVGPVPSARGQYLVRVVSSSAAGGSRIGVWVDVPNITTSNGAITVKIVPRLAYNQSYGQWLYNATISGIKVTAQ